MVDRRKPLGQNRVGIVGGQAQVSLGDRNAVRGALRGHDSFHFAETRLDLVRQLDQLRPRPFRFLLVRPALQHRIRPLGALAHHMNGNVVQVLAGALQQFAGPRPLAAPVSPADQANGRVALFHGLGELNRVRDGFVPGKTLRSVRSLVADLPELDVVRLPHAVVLARRIIRVVGVGNPVRRLAGIAGSITFLGAAVCLDAVAQEVDAVERFGAYAATQVHKFVRADAVGFLAPPDVVPHPRPTAGRPHAFSPLVITAEETAEAYGAGSKVFDCLDEIRTPVVGIVVPGRFHRSVGRAERLHELHVQIRGNVEQRCGVNQNRVGIGRSQAGLRQLCQRGCRP